MKKPFLKLFFLLLLAGCTSEQFIVSNIDERAANEIVVFLASKGVVAQKIEAPSSGAGAAGAPSNLFNISVSQENATSAMALLNQYGLPRRHGTNLLTLFAKGGLVSSDREETIRYQAGLAEELQNTILKMDGVLDADVQISFPPSDTNALPGATKEKVTAAVYVKHQGVMEDPNNHMEVKIKRLMSGSVNGLSYDDVSVISDRAVLADISLVPSMEKVGPKTLQQSYVRIWGITMPKTSLMRFRFVFFSLIVLTLALFGAIGFLIYKFYPFMGMKKETEEQTPPEETPPTGP